MPPIALTVNGKPVRADVEARTHLADFLREQLFLTGTHIGCEHGICGACTVEIAGEIARSCITYAVACDGAEVRTIEGFDDDPLMQRLRRAFSEEHALQCGYCTPGMLIAARDLIRRNDALDERKIRIEMSGNLCRCTGYVGIVRAVKQVAAEAADVRPERRDRTWLGPAPGAGSAIAAVLEAPPASAPNTPDAAAVPLGEIDRDGAYTRLSQSFTVRHPRDRVWRFMGEIEKVATCLPGVTLDAPVTSDRVTGHMAVKLGPIGATFAGEAQVSRDDAAYRGAIEGAGRDRGSTSRAKGRVDYALREVDGGDATDVDVALAYSLAGPLAQFSRGGLVKDLVARLTGAFAENLEARISAPGAPVAPAAELRAGALLWSVLVTRIRALLRRKFGRQEKSS